MALKLDRTKLVKNMGKRYRLVPLIDRYIEQTDEIEWSFEHTAKASDDAWHPSGDCTPSVRDLYFKGTNQLEERPFPASLKKTFMVGHFWHGFLQHIVVEGLGLASWDEVEVRGLNGWGVMGTRQNEVRYFDHIKDPILWKPFHWATGSADICPCEIPGTGPVLVDFKTMGSHDFKRNEAPAWAVGKWECQANIYMDWFKLEEAIFVGILKDTPHDMKEFVFRRNQPLVDAIYNKWKLASLCIEEGIEPPEGEDIELPLQGPVES